MLDSAFLLHLKQSLWRVLLTLCLAICISFCTLFIWGGLGFGMAILGFVSLHVNLLGFTFLIFLGPFSLMIVTKLFRDSIRAEKLLIETHGAESALWVAHETFDVIGHPMKGAFRELIWDGHDQSGDWLLAWAKVFHLPAELQDMIGEGAASIGSRLWSSLILSLDLFMDDRWSCILSLVGVSMMFKRTVTAGWSYAGKFIAFHLTLFMLLWHAPPDVVIPWVVRAFYWALRFAVWVTRYPEEVKQWLSWRFTLLVVNFVAWAEALNTELERKHSMVLTRGGSRLSQHFKAAVMQATIFINDLSLPNWVRTRGSYLPGPDTLKDSLNLMKDLGWPINVEFDEVHDIAEQLNFKEWVLGGSTFKQGIHNSKVQVDEALETLRGAAVAYKRTEQYATVKNELEATSRYFKSPKYDFPDVALEDVWFLLGDIFRHSRLTPFNYIIKMWEKKYALGAFMTDPDAPWKKYKRSKFIKAMGGFGPFKKLWAATFYHAAAIVPVSAVSVKGEALPPSKWMKDKVRTVIGSPITQYILSTIWNYGPNHKFAWESTPIKIGMPLNGYWMTEIWKRHARCQIHVEGDFEAFDSTVSGKVVDTIRAIRKKGYEMHKDRDRIAELIDVNYDLVTGQLLNTTSTGNIYYKGTGLTTGHSSTSMDNSTALVVIYLMAWKDLTGLSAKEFVYYNELSCFGDDHVLSINAAKPAVWTPRNIRSTMKKWGLTNNLDVKKSLDDISFLSKKGRRANAAEVKELASYGVKTQFIVWHMKDKLVGKLTAPVRSMAPSYRLKRLLSYLSLTAHHRDVYDGIVNVISSSKSLMSQMKNNKLKIPTYGSVLRNWYAESPGPLRHSEFDSEVEEFENTGKVVTYGNVSLLDGVVGALSMVPDFLSPLLFNYGFHRAFQGYLYNHLCWVPDLMALSNSILGPGTLEFTCSRTNYRWLETSLFSVGLSGCNTSTLLLRHWLFCFYTHKRPALRWAPFANFVVKQILSIQYLINGRVGTESRDAELSIDLVVVASLLSWVDIPDWFPFVSRFVLPDVQLLLDSIIHYFLVTIWSSVPPNFRETTSSIRKMDPQLGPIGVEAPTGTGKSTAFIQHLNLTVGDRYDKIVVIEPTSKLVLGLVGYMQVSYGLSVSGATTGLRLDRSKKVFYLTPVALMSHLDLLNHNNLFVLDEAHRDEEWTVALRLLLKKARIPSLFVTATMTEDVKQDVQLHLQVPIANLWTVTSHIENVEVPLKEVLSHYEKLALEHGNHVAPGSRALIFVPTRDMADRLAGRCRKQAAALHSMTSEVSDWNKSVYFATPVAEVGITVPDVNLVVSPNFHLGENNRLLSLPSATIQQRKGRTGRTNNGLFKFYEYSGVKDVMPGAEFTAKNVQALIMNGMPPRLAWALSKESVLSAFGMAGQAESENADVLLRGIEVFMQNIAPVLRNLQAASMTSDPLFGDGYVLHHTGVGNISSSYPQPGGNFRDLAIENITMMLRAKARGDTIPNWACVDEMDRIAGPIVRVKNLVQSWLCDEETSSLNPKNSEASGLLSDVYEIKEIFKLLNSIKNQD
ncbi:RNA-dependent RNA polymerase [Botryosphaeria dothidea fusarivirus 2]|nr:RNA-dependent RNA polymerase [Botryosphaeria dothidea fusarivirus 2]